MDTNRHNFLQTLVSKRLTTATALTVFCLLISACAPGTPVESVEVSETATITATLTAEVTPTNTVEPTAIPGGVLTDQGIVFVEDGKCMIADENGIRKEIKDL